MFDQNTSGLTAEGFPPSELTKLTDANLYSLCKEYGLNARVWKRKFAGLLPEVLRRELYRRRGYTSIYEFAFKLAGMSEPSVDKVLYLAEKLVDKPHLRAQLLSGSQGWSKIEKVAYVATPETDKEWASRVESMPFHGLEAYVQIVRRQNGQNFTKNENDEEFTRASLPGNNFKTVQWNSLNFPVSPEIEQKLRLLKHELEKEKKITLTFNEVLKELLEGKKSSEPQIVIQVCPECAARKATELEARRGGTGAPGVRPAIPVMVRRLIQATYQGFCAFPSCIRAGTSLHHTKRYALDPSHDPKSIVPLCKFHERLVHGGYIENEEDTPAKWRVRGRPDPSHPKYEIDQAVAKWRKEGVDLLKEPPRKEGDGGSSKSVERESGNSL